MSDQSRNNTEPLPGILIQCDGDTYRRGSAVSDNWMDALADDRWRSDGFQQRQRCHEFSADEEKEAGSEEVSMGNLSFFSFFCSCRAVCCFKILIRA